MSKLVDEMIKFRELLTPEPQQLNEAWDAKMHTAKKDVGKWDGYSISELKAKKAKLMKKATRSAAEQKTVKQIDFAIRAKQKNKWGKIKESIENMIPEDVVTDDRWHLTSLTDNLRGLKDKGDPKVSALANRIYNIIDQWAIPDKKAKGYFGNILSSVAMHAINPPLPYDDAEKWWKTISAHDPNDLLDHPTTKIIVDQLKNLIHAVVNSAQGEQVNEDGMVNENEKVKIIAYNSGHGQQLDAVAKDPKHHREVEVVQLRLGYNNAPELVFKDTGGNSTAQWNAKYGWVADFD